MFEGSVASLLAQNCSGDEGPLVAVAPLVALDAFERRERRLAVIAGVALPVPNRVQTSVGLEVIGRAEAPLANSASVRTLT